MLYCGPESNQTTENTLVLELSVTMLEWQQDPMSLFKRKLFHLIFNVQQLIVEA